MPDQDQMQQYPYFQASPAYLRVPFDSYIKNKLKGFVGRQFVFDALDDFIQGNPSGYFILRGDPGIGKSAVLAKIINDRGYIHHFNIALQNIRSTRAFLENICLQVIARYNLPYPTLPQNATDDSGFLMQCLTEAAEKTEEPIVIGVDALDEADLTGLAPSVNVLYLPYSLPDGVYIAVTVRRIYDLRLQVERPQVLDLEAGSDGNLRDIRTYIGDSTEQDLMQKRITAWKKTVDEFVEIMVKKSQGNFMYLYHVLPAIEKGDFKDGGLDELPLGLSEYYKRHWRQMREGDDKVFESLYEPIVCILGVAREPVSAQQIANWTYKEKSDVQRAIEKWFEFLQESTEDKVDLYRIYHASFQDFLADQVDLTKYDGMIADYYLALMDMDE